MFQLIDFIIVRPIVNILFVIYNIVGDFGIAIIIFTILVKILMWPLVKRQFYQTKLMRKIQPELAEIKKNCKGNRQLESLQMMDLYKRNNIKPFRSILTLLIQLPLFIALYTAIRVVVMPNPTDNVAMRAYPPIAQMERITEIREAQAPYLENASVGYEFQPKLFWTIDLGPSASSVLAGNINISSVVILLLAISSAIIQYFSAKQQLPSNGKKSKSFREIMKAASEGKDPDQAELNAMTTRQMSFMMPLMMFFIMFNLPGALALYYFLTTTTTLVQQRIVLNKAEDEMEISADKAVLKELKNIKEAKIIENKKSGTKITRISAKDNKKKRRK